jgi:VanZ family protein
VPGDSFPEITLDFGDKIVHVFLYFLLMIFTYISFAEQKIADLKDNLLIYSFIFTVLYGITDEIHQYFVPNRLFDFYDIVANTAGAAVGMATIMIIIKRKIKLTTIK